jgi:hypothetical protein
MLPDPGRYEERYRLTGAAWGLASALVVFGLGFLRHTHLISAALTVLITIAIPAVLAVALRPVAFRADHAGITLGSAWQLPGRPAVFIPWADVEKIILYPGYTSGGDQVHCIGSSAGTEPRPCPAATSKLPGAPSPASRPGRHGRSRTGGWTASSWPPSPPQWRRASLSSTPATTPTGASKDQASAKTRTRMASDHLDPRARRCTPGRARGGPSEP